MAFRSPGAPSQPAVIVCRLSGVCDLISRDVLLGTVGVAQCVRCSTVYQATALAPRICAHCDRAFGESTHDPCIGRIDGAVEACCGHGDATRAYVSYADGRRIEGGDVLCLSPL